MTLYNSIFDINKDNAPNRIVEAFVHRVEEILHRMQEDKFHIMPADLHKKIKNDLDNIRTDLSEANKKQYIVKGYIKPGEGGEEKVSKEYFTALKNSNKVAKEVVETFDKLITSIEQLRPGFKENRNELRRLKRYRGTQQDLAEMQVNLSAAIRSERKSDRISYKDNPNSFENILNEHYEKKHSSLDFVQDLKSKWHLKSDNELAEVLGLSRDATLNIVRSRAKTLVDTANQISEKNLGISSDERVTVMFSGNIKLGINQDIINKYKKMMGAVYDKTARQEIAGQLLDELYERNAVIKTDVQKRHKVKVAEILDYIKNGDVTVYRVNQLSATVPYLNDNQKDEVRSLLGAIPDRKTPDEMVKSRLYNSATLFSELIFHSKKKVEDYAVEDLEINRNTLYGILNGKLVSEPLAKHLAVKIGIKDVDDFVSFMSDKPKLSAKEQLDYYSNVKNLDAITLKSIRNDIGIKTSEICKKLQCSNAELVIYEKENRIPSNKMVQAFEAYRVPGSFEEQFIIKFVDRQHGAEKDEPKGFFKL